MKRFLACLTLCAASLASFAWDNHSQLSYSIFEGDYPKDKTVMAESLDSFLRLEAAQLPGLLGSIEKASIEASKQYRPTPAALAFKGSEMDLRLAFIHALRVNPKMSFPLFVQLRAGADRDARPDLAIKAVDLYENRVPNAPFKALVEGEEVKVLEVLASASDEPDYGMDIGLFEDNKSEVSALYGFGVQPFGNPALPFGSQAPFHMTFANEAGIIKMAAPFTKVSYAEWRFRLYTELSRFAFAEAHPYWGYRFAGWALHYLEDVDQPYHSSLYPSRSALGLIWFNLTASKEAYNDAVVLLSNRHALVEDFFFGEMAVHKGDTGSLALYRVLSGLDPASTFPKETDAIQVFRDMSKRAFGRGKALDRLLAADFPAEWTSDPKRDFSLEPAHDSYGWLGRQGGTKAGDFEKACLPIFADLRAGCRSYLSGLAGSGMQAP